MSNLITWINEIAEGEEVEAVVIGEMGWGDYGSEKVPNYADQPRNKAISWIEAQKWLDYEFDAGYGAPGCNAIYVWTKSQILFVSQYDGSTSLCRIPRHPTDCKPDMPGG